MHSKLYIPARSATLPYTVDVTPESAGWTETSLQVLDIVELIEVEELGLQRAEKTLHRCIVQAVALAGHTLC